MKTLILGGVRSGKSRLAETLANQSGLPVCYIATASAGDDEMHQRIAVHRARRPTSWTVVEEPYALAEVLHRHAVADHCIIIECLTLWLTNLLVVGDERRFTHERDALIDTLHKLPGTIILVGNEVGLGIMPLGELTRRFCDETGRLHQELTQHCDRVILTVAGQPLTLKGEPL